MAASSGRPILIAASSGGPLLVAVFFLAREVRLFNLI